MKIECINGFKKEEIALEEELYPKCLKKHTFTVELKSGGTLDLTNDEFDCQG